jgi:hypothetical protein
MNRLNTLTIVGLTWLLLACGQVESEQVAIATITPTATILPTCKNVRNLLTCITNWSFLLERFLPPVEMTMGGR